MIDKILRKEKYDMRVCENLNLEEQYLHHKYVVELLEELKMLRKWKETVIRKYGKKEGKVDEVN